MSDSDEFWSADEEDSKTAELKENSKRTFENRDTIPTCETHENSVHKHNDALTTQTERIAFNSDSSVTELGVGSVTSGVLHTAVDREEMLEAGKVADTEEKSGVAENENDTEVKRSGVAEKENDTEEKRSEVTEKERDTEEKREVVIPELDAEELERVKTEVLERKEAGNQLFRSGEFSSAMEEYSSGLEMCPPQLSKERSVLLSNRSVCRLRLGEDQLALADCSEALELEPAYAKARLRRAQLFEQLGKLEEALEDYNQLLKTEPSNREARNAVPRLTVEVEKQREALKTEAISKLKDLGNMFLNPFGISTNDFKFVQDPSTGGYNVSFEKKS